MIRENRDESDEGELLRESMEWPWNHLDKDEIAEVRSISVDLYGKLIHGLSDIDPKIALRSALDARDRGDFLEAMRLFRICAPAMDPAQLAYARGTIWRAVREFGVAAEFFRFAADLEPTSATFRYFWLESLAKVDRPRAIQEAEAICLNSRNEPPRLALAAANMLITYANFGGSQPTAIGMREVANVLQDSIDRLRIKESATEEGGRFLADAYRVLWSCHVLLGDRSSAGDAISRGLALAPEHPSLLVARGLQRYIAGDEGNAELDFEKAMTQGTHLFGPYLVLAYKRILDKDFRECLELCENAINRNPPAPVMAKLYEMMAICHYSLDFPPAVIRASLCAAVELTPDDQRLRANLREFEQAASSASPQPIQWQMLSKIDVQQTAASGVDTFLAV